mmetsp:Transcript_21707/g.15551  ORF Transcript_21707/g.15551 Transcript_21707/m.15551 type:complete len:88 (-) Transcript_21707:765-1028(-)
MVNSMGNEGGFSFPSGSRDDTAAVVRAKLTPGPGNYNNAGPLPFTNGTGKLRPGKSILGGAKGEKKKEDNSNPGPGHYDPENPKSRP